jgi:cell division septal protein FtsQ
MFGRKNKKKNERKSVLDVKSRARPLKAMRLRMATGALAVSAGLVLSLFVFWKGGEFMIDEYIYHNPAFAIEKMEIRTDGIIPVEQIRSWSNVQPEQNLLALDLGRIKRDLELVPLIQSASVERVLPHTLIVEVSEREPIARTVLFRARKSDGLLEPTSLYLDQEGMVIPPVLRALNTAAFDAATRFLPTLTGLNGTEIRPGHKIQSPQALAALRWIRAFQSSPMIGYVDVRSIDLSSPNTLAIQTEQGNEITFNSRDFDLQLARWRKVHDFAARQNRLIASLDLAVTNYVPAMWQDQTGTNSLPPLVRPNNSPYKKRHV